MDENKLGWYVKNLDETLIQGVKAAETIEYNDKWGRIQTELDEGEEGIMKK